MRIFAALTATILFTLASPAQAGMQLTLVMVAPDEAAHLKRDEDALAKLLFESKSDLALSIGKEWHGIHYLLTGDAEVTSGLLGQVILGGTEFGPDLGYGPARVLTQGQVKEFAAQLQALSLDEFKRRYDPKAMVKAKIYPGVWDREEAQALGWLVVGYQAVVKFYVRAAAEGKAVILAIM
ncbi:MAG: YfbM family protein [Gammaproteobacteria bacterium]|nr:YfbM family protein [Gammaproteobacteria bacterium]